MYKEHRVVAKYASTIIWNKNVKKIYIYMTSHAVTIASTKIIHQ